MIPGEFGGQLNKRKGEKVQEYCLFIDEKEVQREFVTRLQDSVDLRGGILRIYSEPDQIGVFNTPCLYAPEGIFRSVNSINNFSAYLRRKEEGES